MAKQNRRNFMQMVAIAPIAMALGMQAKMPNEPDSITHFLVKRYNELMKGKANWGKQVTIILNERWFNKFKAETPVMHRFNDVVKVQGIQPLKFKTANLYMDKILGWNQWRMVVNDKA